MRIDKKSNNNQIILCIEGRLDTLTSPELDKEIYEISNSDITELIIDMERLEYISSAGLRSLLKAQKMMDEKGKMEVIHVNEAIMEVFEISGFSEILIIR